MSRLRADMRRNPNKDFHFYYEGMDSSGQKIDSIIQAESPLAAKLTLYQQGIHVLSIRKKRRALLDSSHKAIKQADITLFSRQLALMLKAGIPLVKAFDILFKSQAKIKVKRLLKDIQQRLEGGRSLAESLRAHRQFFNDLFCNLIHVGEQSGSLEEILDKIATYKERMDQFKKKIKKALAYPIALVLISLLLCLALLTFVVPQFELLFKDFGADLPFITRLLMKSAGFFQSFWIFLFSLLALLFTLFQFNKERLRAHKTLNAMLLKIPILGSVLQKACIARFTRTLSICYAAGLPLIEALMCVSEATGHVVYKEASHLIRTEISKGQAIHVAMEKTSLFPMMVIQMIAIGEEAGSLEYILANIAHIYEEEVDNDVEVVSNLLEPVIMSIVGLLIAGLVIAMYLPIFKLGSVI